MTSGEDDPTVNESTAALVNVQFFLIVANVLLLEDRDHPGELAELGLIVLGAGDTEADALGVALTAASVNSGTGGDWIVG